MITKKIGKNYICYDLYNYENNKTLKFFLDNFEYKTIFSEIEKNMILVLGGDGTLLKAIKKNHRKKLTFLGINFGTIGYLLNKIEKLKNLSKYKIQKYPLLEVCYKIKGKKYSGICFNEVNITVGDGKVLDLEVLVGEEKYLFRGDGILVSTPAGSTGYNRSLFGPILEHKEEKFILTPKADINLQKSIVFKNTKKVLVKNIHRLNPIEIYLDGNKLGKKVKNREVEIFVEKSDKEIEMIIL